MTVHMHLPAARPGLLKARQIVRDPRHHPDQTILDACAILAEHGDETDRADALMMECAIKEAWLSDEEDDGELALVWIVSAAALTLGVLIYWWLT